MINQDAWIVSIALSAEPSYWPLLANPNRLCGCPIHKWHYVRFAKRQSRHQIVISCVHSFLSLAYGCMMIVFDISYNLNSLLSQFGWIICKWLQLFVLILKTPTWNEIRVTVRYVDDSSSFTNWRILSRLTVVPLMRLFFWTDKCGEAGDFTIFIGILVGTMTSNRARHWRTGSNGRVWAKRKYEISVMCLEVWVGWIGWICYGVDRDRDRDLVSSRLLPPVDVKDFPLISSSLGIGRYSSVYWNLLEVRWSLFHPSDPLVWLNSNHSDLWSVHESTRRNNNGNGTERKIEPTKPTIVQYRPSQQGGKLIGGIRNTEDRLETRGHVYLLLLLCRPPMLPELLRLYVDVLI